MKNMRKILAILLALVMVFALVACGDPGASNTESPNASPNAEPTLNLDTTGMTEVSGTIHFGDTFAACTVYYDLEKWGAVCQNAATEMYVPMTGTMDWGTLVLDADSEGADLLEEVQSLFDEKAGMKTVKQDVDFGIAVTPVTLRYNDTMWSATFYLEAIPLSAEFGGTIEDGKLIIKKDNADGFGAKLTEDGVQPLYESVAGKIYEGVAQSVTGPMDMWLWANSTEWEARFYVADANQNVVLSGTLEDGTLILVEDSSGGFGDQLVLAVQDFYDEQTGAPKTIVGDVDFGMGDPVEVTLVITGDTWTCSFFFGAVGEDVNLSGNVVDGNLEVVEDSTGGFAGDLIATIQSTLYGGTPEDADDVVEVTLPDMADMAFHIDVIDMNGMAAPVVSVGYNDTTWVLSYYFDPVDLHIFITGSIVDGQLVIEQSTNPYAGDTIDLFQALYDDGLANGANTTTVVQDMDFNGMATLPVTLRFNDEHFVLTYNFTMANKNVMVTGDIVDGQLVVVNDNSNAAADMLANFQAIYDSAK